MYRTAIGIAVLLGLLTVQPDAARAQATPATQGKRIAHLTSHASNPFIAALSKAMSDRAKELGMTVTAFYSPFDPALQAQQVDDTIAQKFDILALVAVSEQAILPALARVKAAGIPVLLVNTPPKEGTEDTYLSFVGERHEDLGKLTGEQVLKALREGGRDSAKIALVTGSMQEGVAPRRVNGFKEVLAKHPKIEIVASEDAKWDTAGSERIAGQLFARFAARGGLDAIYAMADNQSMAVIQAAEAAGIKLGTKKGELIVVGSNCLKPTVGLIKAGKLYSSGTQLPVRTGRHAAELIADHFNGKKLAKTIIQPVEAITKDNIDKWAEACTF